MLADIKDLKPFEYWKRVICVMMIHAGYQNADILTATAQCSVNTVNTVRRSPRSRGQQEGTLQTFRLRLYDRIHPITDEYSFRLNSDGFVKPLETVVES